MPLLPNQDFWSEYHRLQFIDKVSFTLITPNIFGSSKQALTNVYENAEITSKWHHSCFCQGDLPCLLAMYAYQQMTRTQIYNVMR
ncbi:hypothetical protein S829_17390 [Salmonella enterica]|nr:hypothetical protein [Salmonella enterica]EBO9789222.1 hypothetical protein [Salmonella enterica]EBR3712824.1 hypothetical protein [Salmonella enterica]